MWHWGISSIITSTVTKLVFFVCVWCFVCLFFVLFCVVSSNDVLESPFGKAGLLNILSFPVLLVQPALSRVFPGCTERGWGRLSGSSCSTVLREVYLPNAQVGKTPSISLGFWCWVPQLP